MAEVVVYHNPDSMDYPATQVVTADVVTNKEVGQQFAGSRVWLVTGEGTPRRYYLRLTFRITRIESGHADGFRTRISGDELRLCNPMVEITREPWLPELRKAMGNFAFGFQTLRDLKLIRGLEQALAKRV